MGTRTLAGKRVVVVGASAGIGRAFALRAIRDGAQVVTAARRADRLEELDGSVAVVADIREPDGCNRIADAAREHLGQVDLLFTSVGYAPLRMFADTSVEDWRAVLETNVVGVHQLIRSALPVLAPGAIVAALSSESVNQPWIALGAYASSKAALEHVLHSWRIEHSGIRFSCVVVGSTIPTEFGNAFDGELLTRALQEWASRGLAREEFMRTDDVAEVLCGLYAAAIEFPGVGIDSVTVKSPSAVITNVQHITDAIRA